MTNAWFVWFLPFITHVNSNNIVMWETLHNNVGWDCFRTLILPEILKTQNQHQEDSCAHSVVIHLFQQVGCARNKHLSHTVQRMRILFLFMQVYAWMGFHLLIFGIWFLKCAILPKPITKVQRSSAGRLVAQHPNKQAHPKSNQDCNPARHSWIVESWLCFVEREIFSFWCNALCFWGQRSSDQNDHQRQESDNETRIQNPQSCSWLAFWQNQFFQRFKSNTSTPNTNSQTYWRREISHVMSGIIFSICSTSAISASFAALRLSVSPVAPERWRKGCNNRKETTGSWQSQSRRWREHNQDAASSSQVWQKDAILDESTRRLAAAEKHQELLNFHENLKITRKPVASGNSNSEGTDKIWPHNLQTSTAYIPASWEVFSNTERYRLSPGDKNGTSLNVNAAMWGIFMSALQSAVHLGKDYSENVRSTRNQPMKPLKQLIQVSNWETDQGSDR